MKLENRTVFTLGYEGLSLSAFIALLKENEVDRVVDVRERPLSRKPGFSKGRLMAALVEEGFEYEHRQPLGCPLPVRNAYREHQDWALYTEGFVEHLGTSEPQAHLAVLARDISKSERLCLICYEADANFCHRSLIAEVLQAGFDDLAVVNLRAAPRAIPAACA